MNTRLLFHCLYILAFVSLSSCKDNIQDQDIPEVKPPSTWSIIQQRIFEPSCVICHTAGTTFALQSGLILTEDVAYSQLIDRQPTNTAAREDGLLLLETEGFVSLANSFLWEKINATEQAHFYEDHPEYGGLMPLGGLPLTKGELEYIRSWIIKGAPEDGVVADENLLEDTTRCVLPEEDYKPLSPPANGYQLKVGPFSIAPNYEREFFYYHPLNTSEDIFIRQIDMRMKAGSHHFILFGFPENPPDLLDHQYRDLRDEYGEYKLSTLITIADQIFVFGTQWRDMSYTFPDGIALRHPKGQGFDMNAHYVNRTSEVKEGEVMANIHIVDSSEVSHIAENLFLNNIDFELPPGKVTTIEKTFIFDERRYIFLLTSHAHEHMLEFRIFIKGGARDGELIFYSNDWEHPLLLELDPPLVLEPGQGLRAMATYDNWTNRTLSFGLLSEDEMMIVFGAYYTD